MVIVQNQFTVSSNCDTHDCHMALCLLEHVTPDTPYLLCKTLLLPLKSIMNIHLLMHLCQVVFPLQSAPTINALKLILIMSAVLGYVTG